MRAVTFSDAKGVTIEEKPVPTPREDGALVRVTRAGICATDLEIIKGYVPGYCSTLGHEFVGVVDKCAATPELVGKRVVGEINNNCAHYKDADPVFQRNHAPGRTVLGIIAQDGAFADYLTLPVENLHIVPDGVSDAEACFAEPLAAACRIVEQSILAGGEKVAVVGDGKLGLLCAQVLALRGAGSLTLFGRHMDKMEMVSGVERSLVADKDATLQAHAGKFDVVVEATGSSNGILMAMGMARPMGAVVQKSTCSLKDPSMPGWSEIANDIVVNEKRLIGSRCGPFPPALDIMAEPAMKSLLAKMISADFPLEESLAAIEKARTKGVLKVQLIM